MKRLRHLLGSGLLCLSSLSSPAQVGLKTNLAGWGATNVNLGLEAGVGKRSTLEVMGYLNPWDFRDGRRFHLWAVQPEYRLWLSCGRGNGHFLGVHALGGQYNARNVNFPLRSLTWGGSYDENPLFPPGDHEGAWPDLRGANSGRHAEGWYVGAGVTYGYQWMLSRHWNLEASAGVGYAYSPMKYYGRCERCVDKRRLHYAGPTNLQLSLIYIF